MLKTLQFSAWGLLLTTALAGTVSGQVAQPAAQGVTQEEASKTCQQMMQLFTEAKYAEALPLAKQNVTNWEQVKGAVSNDAAIALLWQGQIEDQLGRYAEAQKSFLQSLKIKVKLFGGDHPELIGCLAGLASVALNQGNYGDCEALYRQVIALHEKSPNRNEVSYLRDVDSLGVVLQSLGRFDEAEVLHRRALRLAEQAVGATHPDYANVLNNLAQVYQKQAKHVEAVKLYRQALEIKERVYPADHIELAVALSNLAGAIYKVDLKEANERERRSLAIREKALPADHPDIAKSYNSLAIFAFQGEDLSAAETAYRRALKIFENSLPAGHPYIACGVQNLATALHAQRKFLEAKQLYERALEIEIKALGNDHPDVAGTLENLSSALVSLEQFPAATDVIDRQRRITRRHAAHVLPSLSMKQQIIFLGLIDSDRYYSALSFGLRERNTPDVAIRSAGWLLNGKALAHQALTQNSLLLRESSDPEMAAQLKNLVDLRARIASFVMSAGGSGDDSARQQQIKDLEAQEQQLSDQIAKAGCNPPRSSWVEVEKVRQAIPADGLLIEIAHFWQFDFDTKVRAESWKAPRYAAWIIPPAGRGDIKIVDLGEAKPIEAAIRATSKPMSDAQRRTWNVAAEGQQENVAAEQAAREPLAQLASLIWEPIAKHVGDDTKQILLSPDAMLWQAPWCALPVAEGKYLVEKYPIRYLVSGRDLVADKSTDKTPANPIIFADPNFDLDQGAIDSATRAVLRGTRSAKNNTARSVGPKRSSTVLPRVQRLKGTADEAAAIKPALAEYTRNPPLAYLDHYATEGIFKAMRSPQVLVMSTHGFFMPDRASKPVRPVGTPANADAISFTPLQRFDSDISEHPLLRCGLLLAGCNQRGAGREAERAQSGMDNADDGILTGMEIASTDLRGTELVVLSACETGLGDVQAGDGVAGLRQAFQLAGAKSVVATLWQIPDEETAALMTAFFKHLATGESKAEALRSAQLELIKSHREKYSVAHPYFWAAFTVTGD